MESSLIASTFSSIAIAITIKFSSFKSSNSVCQPGRSKAQPHQLEKATSSFFLSLHSDRECNSPSTSGSSMLGALRSFKAELRSKEKVSTAARPNSTSRTLEKPRVFATSKKSTYPLSGSFRGVYGIQDSSLQSPSGLISQPRLFSMSVYFTNGR